MTTKTKSGRSPTTFASSSTSSRLKSMRCVRRSPRRFRKRPSSFPRWPATPKRSGTTSCTTPKSAELLDQVGQMCKGVFIEAEGFVQSFWTLDPARAVVDPKGFWHSVSGALDKLESLTGLEGEQRLTESWKELGKDTVHWDEWRTNPFEAAGESVFDLATVLVPGGALEKLPMVGRAAAEVAEAPKDLHLPAPVRLPDPAPSRQPSATERTPRSGQPSPRPRSRTEAKSPLPPYGLTESKTPASPKPATASDPKPAVGSATIAARAVVRTHSSTPGAATGLPSASLLRSGRLRNHIVAHRVHTNLSHCARPLRTRSPRRSTIDDRGSFGPERLHWAGTRGPKRRVEDWHHGRISTCSC